MLACCALPVLIGCQGAIHGEWYLVTAKPNRQMFSIDHAAFRPDGTYTATTTIEGVTNQESGTYDFNGFQLKLRPHAGGQRSYTVQMQPNTMQVGDAQRNATLRKGKRGS
jgi:hypothetical protein